MTFARSMRPMPASPIADNNPPIVVGIRHTSSATSTVIVIGLPALATSTLYTENGSSVTVANMNTSVSLTSRIISAISFGVFCRRALSTIEIMRSRNDSPGLAVTRTTSQSDSTRVPPVTELKSPPDSRMTGADSPVIADSSTDATPSITSPSAGMKSPASTRNASPVRNAAALTRVTAPARFGSESFFAIVSRLAARNVSACALLRPSAIASAKFANSTVNHSHSVIARMKPAGASPCPANA